MFTVALAALAVSAQILGSAQACSSVLSVAEANGLTLLLAGVESLEGQPQSGLFLTALRAGFPFPAQFTIYAPSDAAFEASFPGGLPAADVLGGVLVSHVSNNAESSADLAAQAVAAAPAAVSKTTVGSGSLALTTDATGALFIGLADSTGPPSKIVTPDLETCAGTLHVINRVMLPPELLPPAPAPAPPPAVLPAPLVAPVVAPLVAPVVAPAPVPVVAPVPVQVPAVAPVAPVAAARVPTPAPAALPVPAAARALVPAPAPAPAEPPAVGPAPVQEQCEPFTDAITDAGLTRLQALVTAATDYPPAAVIMAALTSAERTAQQFTVFAPQDEALRAVLPGYTGPVKSTEVLSNHVVLGAWDAAALLADIQGAGPGGLALPTLGGARLLLTTDGLSIFILPEGSPAVTAPAVVEEADFLACGGVLHVIDSVLVEGSEPVDGPLAGLSTPNVVEVPEGFGEAPGPADVLAPAPAEVLEAQSGCGHQQRRLLVLACAAAAVFSVVLT